MIPIKLSIAGLYSYQEKQTIDFTTLLQGGLFGIFGKVGSGKSSILEAISFGLYGETERLNQKDNRAYNMMNLKSDRATIEFEFYNFENKKYKIYREFKRNGKKYHDVKRENAVLYEFEDDQWIPQENFDMHQIIGLSYANFKRTIIIPQGKFKEFIELGGKDRTKMMQEIFSLDRFDLSNKVKIVYGKTKEELDQIIGQLQSYNLIEPSLIGEIQERLKKFVLELKDLQEHFTTQNKRFEQLKILNADVADLQQRQQSLLKLDLQAEEVSALEQCIIKYELYCQVFEYIFKDKKHTLSTWSNNHKTNQSLVRELKDLTIQCEEVKVALSTLEPLYNSLDKPKRILQDYELLKQVKENQENLVTLTKRYKRGEVEVDKQKLLYTTAKDNLVKSEKALYLVKKTALPSETLMKIGQWFTEYEFINQTLIKLIQTRDTSIVSIQKIDQELSIFNFTSSDWKLEIENQRNKSELILTQTLGELEELRVSHRLTLFAQDLSEGKACPLCGSTTHPKILHSTELNQLITVKQQEINELNTAIDDLRKKENTATICFEKLSFAQQQLAQHNQDIIKIESQRVTHQDKFVWQEFVSPTLYAFNELQSKEQHNHLKIKEFEINQARLKKQIEDHHSNLERYTSALSEIQVATVSCESEIKAILKQIQEIDYNAYKDVNAEKLESDIITMRQDISHIEEKYKAYSHQNLTLAPILGAKEQQVKQSSNELEQSRIKLDQLQVDINERLLQHNITQESDVELVLNNKIDVSTLRKQVDDFRIKWEIAKDQVIQLQTKLEGISFDKTEFIELQEIIQSSQDQINFKRDEVAQQSAELQRIEKELAKKEKLKEVHQTLEKRISNISILDNMFKGAGFVNYVSSIYLRNLCDMANKRFHRLTNNHLSLQLNEANDFEIIDYLNNGKSRSVKTLSGGQGFQVSLSLALALAESVQSLSKSENNFFFIDEGFGTLDQDSINAVFDTLNDLKSQNRMVGIISHVDELQEKITMSLSIEKDQEKGSVISLNY